MSVIILNVMNGVNIKKNSEVYRSKNPPYSRYLTSNDLLQDLILLFGTIEHIEIKSTQNNECFSRTVAKKTKFYCIVDKKDEFSELLQLWLSRMM